MRITLNLASKPFIELRPLYARLRWLMAILLLAAIPLWFLVRTEQRKAALANARTAFSASRTSRTAIRR
jgi:type IV pilus assembly protein PilN